MRIAPALSSVVACGLAATTFFLVYPAVAQLPAAQTLPPDVLPAETLPAGETQRGEVRALWIVRDTLTSPQKIKNAVTLAKKYGFNTLFVQVRGRGDAYYKSNFEPRAEQLIGQAGDFDPLAVAVAEGHKAGLEVHAWMNTFLVWHQKRRPYSRFHVVNQHTDWIVRDRQNILHLAPTNDSEGAFLDPAIPAVREYTKNVFLDVASRYDVDGIHFDYVRYPSERFSYSDVALAAFRTHMEGQLSENDLAFADKKAAHNRLAFPYLFPAEWRTWRQSLVTDTVRSISEAAHAIKPNIIVSAAVFPNYQVASIDKAQAWREWLRDGVLDAACPMAYNRSTPLVAAQIRDAVANSYGRPIIAGVGAWQMPAASAIAKGQVCRDLGACGLNFFSYDGMTPRRAHRGIFVPCPHRAFRLTHGSPELEAHPPCRPAADCSCTAH